MKCIIVSINKIDKELVSNLNNCMFKINKYTYIQHFTLRNIENIKNFLKQYEGVCMYYIEKKYNKLKKILDTS